VNTENVALLIRSMLASVAIAAIVVLSWHGTVTGGEAIAALSALVGGILHAAGSAQAARR